MNRRGFLSSIAAAVGAGLVLPELARELIVPERTIVLPPLGGWPNGTGFFNPGHNSLLDVDMLTREMVRILEHNLRFAASGEPYWDGAASVLFRKPAVLTICRPPRL